MSNKKVVLGIAAGVAALAVVGVMLKRKGYLDGACEKAEELGKDLRNKYKDVKESARKKFDEMVYKGGEIADKMKTEAETTAKNIDPATN
ncbi:hypothetical protein [Flavobacterium beibuense]|uniref:YtxH domain-containing protein n=1 Tax=Flavobacterium beibuense TaxID=657326 RepID=A0A444WGW1_9FLAO|nr:hypothetical protein [Flavobacterium beibuense]RYJ45099.1 hypothetical protein NU09_0733 [Flavobacterium beibuense]